MLALRRVIAKCDFWIGACTTDWTVMTIAMLLITIIVVGVLLYLVNSVLPMDAKVKSILNVVVIVLLLLWVLDAFFDLGYVGHVRVR